MFVYQCTRARTPFAAKNRPHPAAGTDCVIRFFILRQQVHIDNRPPSFYYHGTNQVSKFFGLFSKLYSPKDGGPE